jgi:hypothetical protein
MGEIRLTASVLAFFAGPLVHLEPESMIVMYEGKVDCSKNACTLFVHISFGGRSTLGGPDGPSKSI